MDQLTPIRSKGKIDTINLISRNKCSIPPQKSLEMINFILNFDVNPTFYIMSLFDFCIMISTTPFLWMSRYLIMVTKLLLVNYITRGIMHYTIDTKRFVTRGLLHQAPNHNFSFYAKICNSVTKPAFLNAVSCIIHDCLTKLTTDGSSISLMWFNNEFNSQFVIKYK